ncbi:putative RNA-directed DNA polymerase from transposon X-element [Trichonephila clavipes]|nr:putative RNA-directed DNA polymerase from transposon X-element [Trichonephila clavipes]
MPENLGSSMCLQSHRQLPANSYRERSKQRMAFIGNLLFRYWKHRLLCIRHLLMWPTCRKPLPYICDFDMLELKVALSSAHNTSPGPDGISYELLRQLNEDSLVSLLYLFNRIWREQVYPTEWQEAIVISILKPGKRSKEPSQLSTYSTHELPL